MEATDDIVYGVCLPAAGFSALFVVASLLTVISIIVSGFVCYQRQMRKAEQEAAPEKAMVTMVTATPTTMSVLPTAHDQHELAHWFRKTRRDMY
jgi:hypothetical protein